MRIGSRYFNASRDTDTVTLQSIIDSFGSEDKVAINFGSDVNKKQGKKTNKKEAATAVKLEEHEIPSIEIKKLK